MCVYGTFLFLCLFNIYTNDQPLHDRMHSFIYADNLCVTAQHSSFTEVERTIGDALDKLTQYRSNSPCPNPDKTQVTAFHLRNKDAKRSLKLVWNKTELENTLTRGIQVLPLIARYATNSIYIHNTKMKVATRTNLLRKLSNSKWGANANTIRTTALTLSYSVAEYAARHLSGRNHLMPRN